MSMDIVFAEKSNDFSDSKQLLLIKNVAHEHLLTRVEELGAGEICLNSIDADGTKEGFDLEMIRAVRKEVKIPIIASGGAGKVEDFPPAIEAGADAVLAASVFHYGILTIADVKAELKKHGYTVR